MQPSKPASWDSHCIQQSVRAKSVWSPLAILASPHCQALWTCSRPRKACYQHDTEHTDRSAQQTAVCLHTSTWHTYMHIHTHTTGTYAHMHVHITHAQTCLHVHRANLCSSLRLEGSAARLHTCMYLLTYEHACTDNTQSCSQG